MEFYFLAPKFLIDIRIAKDFIENYLSKDIISRCDLDKLQIESGSHIYNDLSTYYLDIIYRFSLQEANNPIER